MVLFDFNVVIVDDVVEYLGKGVVVVWQGVLVWLGCMDWLGGEGCGFGVLIGDWCILLWWSEWLCDGVVEVVVSLVKQGLDVMFLLGDEVDKVNEVVGVLLIMDVYVQFSLQGKYCYVS